MLGKILKSSETELNATDLLRRDHEKVKSLFKDFGDARDNSTKKAIVETALLELIVHAAVEEEIFYPAVRRATGAQELIDEAAEEHHVAKLLIAELADMKPGDKGYDAKFMVLAESVKHHIEEEENEILPKLEKTDVDLEELGRELMQRKEELVEEIQNPETSVRGQSARSRRSMSSRRSGRRPARAQSRRRGRSKAKAGR